MSDSGKPTYQNPNKTTMPQQPTPPPPPPPTTTDNKRLCDYCYTATAVLYCRADTAKLCLSCDREVHFTNQLFSKHARSQLCDSCDASPASIFCETEQSVFCQNCDWEKHSVNGCLVHTRRPFEGFSGCPSVSELMGVLGVEDLGYYNKKGLVCSEGNDDWIDGYEDLLFWKTPAVVSIDDLMTGHDSYDHGGLNFLALGVPPLPKNRNAVCGQHKEQVLHQLRELSRSELNTNIESDTVPSNMLQSLDAAHPKYINAVCGIDTQPTSVAKEEENLLQWFPDPGDDSNQAFVPSLLPDSDFRKSSTIPVKQSNVSGNPNQTNDVQGTELDHSVRVRTSSALPKISSHEPNSQERDSAISRYKEKRKTRRYDKHIRYESRKVRAESRIRVRGRFAKVDP